ncbi:type II secretion system F family protein [Desulfonatronovibrio hydrogenovorans]|uniref:type II secretion system F family protein n=1 Tax=Desulfonatronovibrio hydrogenovorans TaxID=53245 RepID=UPI00048DBF23|nr:type II secretion system F family protein [Desulfonatronovibrio hydrogenovorans]
MPFYLCRAMDPGGSIINLHIEADSVASAAAEARARGVTLISVEESASGAGLSALSPTRFLPISTKDKVLLFRMLATLIKSEVTVTAAVRILHDQAQKANMKHVLGDVLTRVEGGVPLSEAMSSQARVFPEMVVNLVRAGEMGGILDIVFQRIADYMERRSALRKKMFMSFFYPGIVLLVGVAVIAFMVIFVIPRFMGLITGRLPPATQLLMDATSFLQTYGQNILIGFAGLAGLLALMHSLPATRLFLDRYKVYLPVVGPVVRLGIVVSFARTLGLLLESRIPLVEALRATSATLTNTAVQGFLDQVVDRIMAGEPMSTTLKDGWAFTPMTSALAGIGEHSGLMSESMITVAEVHEKLLEDKVARMSAMVEPALILTLGALVGFVVWGLISGMLAMYQGAV